MIGLYHLEVRQCCVTSSLTILALVCYAVVSVSYADSAHAQSSTLELAPSVVTITGVEFEALIERDFIAYDPNYLEHRRVYGERLHELVSRETLARL